MLRRHTTAGDNFLTSYTQNYCYILNKLGTFTLKASARFFCASEKNLACKSSKQSRRHGGHTGAVPPKQKLCPPKQGLCPEEINRLGATGVQIEAQIGVFCGLTPDFKTFLGWRPFFFEITCLRSEKPLEFPISAGTFLLILAPHLVHVIQTGINFSCPRVPLEFTQNQLLVPP